MQKMVIAKTIEDQLATCSVVDVVGVTVVVAVGGGVAVAVVTVAVAVAVAVAAVAVAVVLLRKQALLSTRSFNYFALSNSTLVIDNLCQYSLVCYFCYLCCYCFHYYFLLCCCLLLLFVCFAVTVSFCFQCYCRNGLNRNY